jgi:hypothetical protein
VDFTIKLKPEGTGETSAAADAVKSVREELEAAQKAASKGVNVDKLRVLSQGAEEARRNLARLEAERKNLDKGSSVNISQRRDLDRRIAGAQQDVASKRSSFLKAGGAAVDLKGVDARSKAIDKAKKEEDEAKALAIDPSRKKKSAVEQAQESVKKKKDQALAEKIDPGSKELSKTEKAVKSKFTDPLKLGIAGAAIAAGASLTGLVYKFAPLAMGYMGMARLSMISAQASFNMRRLFVGTNPKPLLDALQRTSQLIDPRTFTGKTLGEFFVRSADGIFNFISKAEPYVRLFFKGMLYGALQAEIAWLKLRIAIQPALNMFPSGIGLMTAFSAGALAIKASFGLMGVGIALGAVKAGSALLSFGRAALVATGPLLPFVAAVVALAAAYEQAIKLKEQWDENSSTQIATQLRADLGIDSKAETDARLAKRQGGLTGDAYDRKYKMGKYAEPAPAPMPKGADKQAAAAGPPIGKNLGLGIVAGLEETKAKVASSARGLVQEAEKAAKDEAEIKSPAAKWRREIGRNLGEGAALGLDDSADRMDSAARTMMPGAPGIGGIGGRAGGGGVVINQVFNGVDLTSARMIAREVRDALDNFAEQYGALA